MHCLALLRELVRATYFDYRIELADGNLRCNRLVASHGHGSERNHAAVPKKSRFCFVGCPKRRGLGAAKATTGGHRHTLPANRSTCQFMRDLDEDAAEQNSSINLVNHTIAHSGAVALSLIVYNNRARLAAIGRLQGNIGATPCLFHGKCSTPTRAAVYSD